MSIKDVIQKNVKKKVNMKIVEIMTNLKNEREKMMKIVSCQRDD